MSQDDSRRRELLARKDAVIAAMQTAITTHPVTGPQDADAQRAFMTMIDGVGLFADILIDIAHPR